MNILIKELNLSFSELLLYFRFGLFLLLFFQYSVQAMVNAIALGTLSRIHFHRVNSYTDPSSEVNNSLDVNIFEYVAIQLTVQRFDIVNMYVSFPPPPPYLHDFLSIARNFVVPMGETRRRCHCHEQIKTSFI